MCERQFCTYLPHYTYFTVGYPLVLTSGICTPEYLDFVFFLHVFLTWFVYILAKDYIEPYMQAVIQGNFSFLENVCGSAFRAGTLLIATLRSVSDVELFMCRT